MEGGAENPVKIANCSLVNTKEKFLTDPAFYEFWDMQNNQQLQEELCLLRSCWPYEYKRKIFNNKSKVKSRPLSFHDMWYNDAQMGGRLARLFTKKGAYVLILVFVVYQKDNPLL